MTKAMYIHAALAIVAGASVYASPALAGADSFNRPKLGPTWVTTAGTLAISGDQLQGTNQALGYQKASATNSAASTVVILGGTDLEYGAVALGNIGGAKNAFIKIQDQGGNGTFNYGAFYVGNNDATGSFFTLTTPATSPAILDAWFCGTTAVMRITAANGVQTYSYNYGTAYGNGAGLGTYGSVGLDNFIGFKGGCHADERPPADAIAVRGSNAIDKTHAQ